MASQTGDLERRSEWPARRPSRRQHLRPILRVGRERTRVTARAQDLAPSTSLTNLCGQWIHQRPAWTTNPVRTDGAATRTPASPGLGVHVHDHSQRHELPAAVVDLVQPDNRSTASVDAYVGARRILIDRQP
jgi:hypothetical protein